jgi:hypothetical protein
VQLALAVAFSIESDDAEEAVAGAAISLSGALLLAAGLWKRPQARKLGSALIVVGAAFAAFWFWTLVLPIVAIIVVIGVVVSEVRSPERAAGAQ